MRLNNHIRERILNAALDKSGIFEEESEVRKLYADFAELARKSVVTDSVLKEIEKVEAMCKPLVKTRLVNFYVQKSTWVYINCAGQRRLFNFNGVADGRRDYSSEFERVTTSEVTLKHGDPLLKKLRHADKERERVDERKEQLKIALKSTLWSVTTDKKLYEVWPEAREFMPIVEGAPSINLPAVPIKELNKLIGLPSAKED